MVWYMSIRDVDNVPSYITYNILIYDIQIHVVKYIIINEA